MTIRDIWQWVINADLTPVLWTVGILFGLLIVLVIFGFIVGSINAAFDRARYRENMKKWAKEFDK
jgi:hypothetical protein